MSSQEDAQRPLRQPPPIPPKPRRARFPELTPSVRLPRLAAISSRYLMNDIQRNTSCMKIINSLLSPRHGRTNSPNAPSDPQQPDVVFSCTITNSRLDDELSVAIIELSNTPQWLQYLNDDPYGFPKKTAFGTLWKVVDRNAIDEHGRTEYIRAVMDGSLNLNYAEMLAEFSDTDVNTQDQDGRTALHWACVLNFSDIVRLCLSVPDCEVGLLDNDGLTAFDISLRNGNRIITTSFYKSLFEIEETHPQEALLRVLTVSSESPADRPDFPGVAIFDPIKDRNKRLVKALIERGIDLKATDASGDTALHIAAAGIKAVGGHMAACVGDNLPVPIAAAKIVAIEIARMLLEAGSDVNAVGYGGATPMHHAVDTGDRMMVQTLLDWEPTPDAKDDKGKTALDRAEENNDEDMVALLTETNKDEPGVQFADGNQTQYEERQTAVDDLVQQPEEDANIDELIALNAVGVISTDNLSVTLLQAVLSGELDMVQSLLDLGADTEAQNPHQETSLHIAAHRGYKDIAARLVAAGAQIEAAQVDKWTPLQIAARYGHTDTAKLLVAAGAQIEAVHVDKWTSLLLAARNGHTDIAKMLVAAGAQIDAVNGDTWTPLHLAAGYGHTDIAKMLVAAGAQIDAVNGDTWTPLHLAARNGHTDIAKMLVAAGAQIDAVNGDRWTPLHLAARNGHTDIAKMLVAAGAQIDAVHVDKWTPLHLAARNGHTDIAKMLVAAGAQIDAVQVDTWTPLHLAARYGHTDIAKMLVAAGAQIDAVHVDKWTPLHLAARNGHTDIAKMLVAAGAQIDAVHVDKWTPLHLAARNGHTDIAKMLVAAGAQIDAVQVDKLTPLHIAARYGHTGTAKMLVAAGAQIEAVEVEKWTPLHIAARYGHTDTAKLLVAAGAQIDAVNGDTWTPLHLAAGYGHTDIAKMLVATGAQTNVLCLSGTPLELTSRHGHTEIVDVLVAADERTAMARSKSTSRVRDSFLRGLGLKAKPK